MAKASEQLFGQLAIAKKMVSKEQLDECLKEQAKSRKMGLAVRIGEMLCKKGYMRSLQVREILRLQGVKVRELGGFEILQKLGQGGMGVVYKARQKNLDRIVAIKILPPQLASNKAFIAQFFQEARAAARLNHPNVVRGIDVGEAGGFYYFAMEYVDGQPLQEMIGDEGALKEKKALRIIEQIGLALQHAAKNKMVHRDIKPDNILIDGSGNAKLSDLGLARVGTDASGQKSAEIFGTPNYISPEQARGEQNVDIRSDIYSLGATFYHAVTGVLPFEADSAAVLMTKHLNEEPVSPRKRNPLLSKNSCAIIAKMMAKDIAARYQSPEELVADVRAALAGRAPKYADVSESAVAAEPKRRGAPARRKPERASGRRAEVPGKNKSWLMPVIIVAAVVLIGIVLAVAMSSGGGGGAENDTPVPEKKVSKNEKRNTANSEKVKQAASENERKKPEHDERQMALFQAAERFFDDNKNNIEKYQEMIAKYSDVLTFAATSELGKKAQKKQAEITHLWWASAEKLFDEVTKKSGDAMKNDDYKTALAELKKFPWTSGKPIALLLEKLDNYKGMVGKRCARFVKKNVDKADKVLADGDGGDLEEVLQSLTSAKQSVLSDYAGEIQTRIDRINKARSELQAGKHEEAQDKVAKAYKKYRDRIFQHIRNRDYKTALEVLDKYPPEVADLKGLREKTEDLRGDLALLSDFLKDLEDGAAQPKSSRTYMHILKNEKNPVLFCGLNKAKKTISYRLAKSSPQHDLDLAKVSAFGMLELASNTRNTSAKSAMARACFCIYEVLWEDDKKARWLLVEEAVKNVENAKKSGLPVEGMVAKLESNKLYQSVAKRLKREEEEAALLADAKPGLAAFYYSGINFEPFFTKRTDKVLDFPGGKGWPAKLGKNNFSIRWLGLLNIQRPGDYTITVVTDDGARLLVDGNVLIDSWKDQGATPHSGDIKLDKGLHEIEIHYYQRGGGAHFQVFWERKGIKKQIIPVVNIFHTKTHLKGNILKLNR